MRTATVTAYMNTGFTGINTPDSPDVFDLPFYRNNCKQLQVLNCLPLSGEPTTSIVVKDFPGLEQTDYIKMTFSRGIEGEYDPTVGYFAKVTGYRYLTSETVEISLLMDYWLTCGGIHGLNNVSGMTKRVHVPKDDDKLFAFVEPDEMINPARVLEARSEEIDLSRYSEQEVRDGEVYPYDMDIVISTIDLYALGRLTSEGIPVNANVETAIKLETVDGETMLTPKLYGVEEFPYPEVNSIWNTGGEYGLLSGSPHYNMHGSFYVDCPDPTDNDWSNTKKVDVTPPNVGIFSLHSSYVRAGVNALHNYGIEDAVLASYKIPAGYLKTLDASGQSLVPQIGLLGRIFPMSRSVLCVADSLPFIYDNAENKKIFSGDTNAYTIVAKATGDNMKFNPEVLPIEPEDLGTPLWRMVGDPRENGVAMAMPVFLNSDPTRWFMNFVKSMNFQNVPITYTGASGSAINNTLNNLSIASQKKQFEANYPVHGLTVGEWMGDSERASAIAVNSEIADMERHAPSFSLNIAGRERDIGIGYDEDIRAEYAQKNVLASKNRYSAFRQQLLNEYAQLDIRNTYVAPNIISKASQTIRELIGNGFLIVKFMLSHEDVMRCDKLLNMFGYKHTKELELSDFTNRSWYNYIEACDVHLNYEGRGYAKWLIEGAEAQVEAGIRIWHKQYDPAYYTSGND